MKNTKNAYFCGQGILNPTHGDRCHQYLLTGTVKPLHTDVYNTNGILVSGKFLACSSLIKAFLLYIIR